MRRPTCPWRPARAPDALRRLLPSLLALASVTVLAAPLPLPAQEAIPPADPGLEVALLSATNAARADHGLAPLLQDEGLARAAREHAAEMARLHYFSHGSPVAAHDTLPKRLALAGSPLVDVAENIVMLGEPGTNRSAAKRAVEDWLNSPPHRKNLLNGSYGLVGFGAARDAQGQLFVVQDFGAQAAKLLGYTLVSASRTVSEIHLVVHAASATEALFRVASDSPVTRRLPAGTSTVVLTTDAEGNVSIVVGVPHSSNDFLVDDGGTLDLETGRYLPDGADPRRLLTITAANVRRSAQRGARLSLRYAPSAGATLSLFLLGSYQPSARVAPGDFSLFLPDTLGLATISVGVNETGASVTIVHRFRVDPGATTPQLLAGAAP